MFQTYKMLHGSIDNEEIIGSLVLHYSTTTNAMVCKNLVATSSKDLQNLRVEPVDWQLNNKFVDWIQFECYYSLDEVFPLIRRDNKLNMEENFGSSVDRIGQLIETSVVFLDGEIVDSNNSVESYISEKKITSKIVQATLYQCYTSDTNNSENQDTVVYDGTIQYHGSIASKVWVHPSNSIKNVFDFIRQDIVRSLSARILIHCDALNESEHINSEFKARYKLFILNLIVLNQLQITLLSTNHRAEFFSE